MFDIYKTSGGIFVSLGERERSVTPYRILSGLFLVCAVLLIPLWHLSSGIRPAVGQEIKKHGKHETGVMDMGMADTDKLTEDEGKYLLALARKTIEQALFDKEEQKESDTDSSAKFLEQRGTFVTLTTRGNLRGCIGHIIPQESLIEGIRVNAINAAFRDPRFPALTRDEWKKVKIEISILTDPKPLSYSDADDLLKKLRPDMDGLIIKKGYHQATFLPQVWEQLPKKEEFLTHLCLKAGLGGDAWRKGELEVSTYQVQAFEE